MRNSKKTEHRLLAVTAFCYVLLFMEEYVRHQLPIGESATIVALWFSNAGIAIPGLGFHFLAKFSGMDKRMPRYVYPYIFYLPLSVIVVNVLSREQIISSSEFVTVGVWKMPVYNSSYYIALSASIFISLLYLAVLYKGRAVTRSAEHRAIFDLLLLGVYISSVWHIVFGFFQFGEWTPPYPYIFGGVIWLFILRLAMIRYDFLNFSTRRYEKMFHMNPAAILLVEPSGHVREANPGARQLFDYIDLDRVLFFALVDPYLQEAVQSRKAIKAYETTIHNGNERLDVLIDGDYVTLENELLAILIVRDITLQKKHQEEIRFLAYHDSLTRLPNRRYFHEELRTALEEAEAKQLQLAVILLDLDRFKETNDKYGHEAGDALLRHVARIIGETAGGGGFAARLGGDEFVLFLRCISSEADVREMMGQLQLRLSEEALIYGDQRLIVELSMGVSFYPEQGRDSNTLLLQADRAMYRHKHEGKAGVRYTV
ncbi:GGDEF domain-containing protein [Paenibacillus koleovorans]|uniref:GGDEF domain-containing protein n=1 Tax=Paenibacillus koleovorans TaxID=121608 RepID=UPI0013E37137|nr:GGDEF domain-containing protein [Paenibacillus koleovorans]